jgi:hypothetical protein
MFSIALSFMLNPNIIIIPSLAGLLTCSLPRRLPISPEARQWQRLPGVIWSLQQRVLFPIYTGFPLVMASDDTIFTKNMYKCKNIFIL